MPDIFVSLTVVEAAAVEAVTELKAADWIAMNVKSLVRSCVDQLAVRELRAYGLPEALVSSGISDTEIAVLKAARTSVKAAYDAATTLASTKIGG